MDDLHRQAAELCDGVIAIADHRLQAQEAENPRKIKLPVHAYLLHLILKADRFVEKAALTRCSEKKDSYLHSAQELFQRAHGEGGRILSFASPITVQAALHLSIMLNDVSRKPQEAQDVAEKAYSAALTALKMTNIDELEMLDLLRDHIANLEQAWIERQQDHEITLRETHQAKSIKKNRRSRWNKRPQSRQRMTYMKQCMQWNAHSCFFIENLNHASEIMEALRKIFKCYVKGNSAPAEMHTGETVELNGTLLPIKFYLLEGPFMKWTGFLSFCHDFQICPRLDGSGHRAVDMEAGESFLLDPKQLGAIFSVAAAAGTNRVLAQQEAAPVASTCSIRSDRSPVEDVDIWKKAEKILNGAEVCWSDGLNFNQFIDCLGRVALVAFASSERLNYDEMYPGIQDKFQALLCSHMGLLDHKHWNMLCRSQLLKCRELEVEDLADVFSGLTSPVSSSGMSLGATSRLEVVGKLC